ncbi:MAG: hypothetical protein A2096_03660 [Spirochaetes bacterium GWF1_41_5]|nr:MAG: hypothetical protein A2096_03660 [Spirochaetes bacterium GWF1_41_5]
MSKRKITRETIDINERDYLTAGECSEIFKVRQRTILAWIKSGKLRDFVTAGGFHRIPKAEVEKLKQETRLHNSQKKVMIIDDESIVVKTLENFIQSYFPDVEIFSSADSVEGLVMLGKLNPDLLILDIKMPDLDGYNVIEKIKNMKLRSKILVISAFLDDETARRLKKIGISNYISKNTDFFKFAEKLSQLLSLHISE